jgi:N-acetyl-gamma-glutamyl-phosphate reductase
MTHAIFIDGQAGTTGLGIARRLASLPGIRLLTLPDSVRKAPDARQEAMRKSDLTILCLPDEAAVEAVLLAEALGDDAPKLLDASTAHRVAPGWVYGFAELWPGHGGAIAVADRVANPGCYATGAIALLRPLVASGLIPPGHGLSINAVSGYSGGGKTMIAAHEQDGGPAFELYALGLAHKHLPEIVHHAGLDRVPIFVPSVGHFAQGMLVCIPLHLDLLPGRVTPADLYATLEAWYPQACQVHVVPPEASGRLAPEPMTGRDTMDLTVYANEAARQAVLVARLDNLGKGASGAAVQNTRLMLGLPA